MNFLLLYTTLNLSKGRSTVWRMFLSAAVGGIYAVLIFIPGYEFLQRFSLKLFLSLIMILISYDLMNFKEFLKIFTFFYMVTFAFGGAALGIYYFFEDRILIENGVFYISDYPTKLLLMVCVFLPISFKRLCTYIRCKFSKGDLIYSICISFDRDVVSTQALLDTGNLLYDPVSNHPVVVIEYKEVREILPSEIKKIFENSLEDDLACVTKHMSNSRWIGRFRLIPFTALGKANGMLIGFKPDGLGVLIDENWINTDSVVVGIYNNRLSKAENYHALINPEIIH
ncbi:MAG TPA: sigma-E processing peptidase SpoIIGA [Clostridiales bacterium]|nr:sigma-E processing peptidase SpoIIGA [Clostridiales bacterium]